MEFNHISEPETVIAASVSTTLHRLRRGSSDKGQVKFDAYGYFNTACAESP